MVIAETISVKLQIGPILTRLIKEKRLTLRAISQTTGVSTSTLHEWQSGRKPKDPVQLQKVAAFLGVSLHFLLFGEEDALEPITKIMTEDFFRGTFEITVKRIKLPEDKR